MEIDPTEYYAQLAKAKEFLKLAQETFEKYSQDIIQKNTGRGKETMTVDDNIKAELDLYRKSASAVLDELVALQEFIVSTKDETVIDKFMDLAERLKSDAPAKDRMLSVMHSDLSTILGGLDEITKKDQALFDQYTVESPESTNKSYA